ncbi:glycine betaine ABC transporter substrate-binding protein [Streptomyces sp. SID13726]|uniref:glycine betaine ABC transporter substrate-binding protein n=1 Tax=Streptomyces sp. SID13726 TaxID=2706058 RepID=UPI0013BB1757|nr:glycine betaine ABC transporter substrate-binding protein [Streptomyces sp. SID13726]NEA98521.1 glycine/betaine ABC transporter substrate-binding protein [Streptomyces sp. SID13726]
MLSSPRLTVITAGLATALLALTACGSGLSEGGADTGKGPCTGVEPGSVDPAALKGVTVKVGSKEFDEQLLLGQLTLKMMCAAGAKAVDETNSKGASQTRAKLTRGESDIYWEYTGTAWVDFLKQKPIFDPEQQYDAVKKLDLEKNGVVWGQRAPFNNTYAFAVSDAFAKKNNVETDSDMAAYLNAHTSSKVCVESEFLSRVDGYPGFKKAYAVTGGTTTSLGIGVIYTQTGKGACDFGEVFTTDGRISALGLHVLKDDKSFFPVYNAVPQVMKKTDEEHPEILQVLKPLAETLTTPVMQELNAEVSAKGEEPAAVATEFLKEKGFLKQ